MHTFGGVLQVLERACQAWIGFRVRVRVRVSFRSFEIGDRDQNVKRAVG